MELEQIKQKVTVIDIYSREKVAQCKDYLFVFGDNNEGVGMGGQAIIRGLPNTFGISTKYSISESYSDDRFEYNKKYILREVDNLIEEAKRYNGIVFPKGGIGTGLASLPQLAPKTFMYLSIVLLNKFGFNNLQSLKPSL